MAEDTQVKADAMERWATVQHRLKRLDDQISEQNADINRSLAISQAVNDKLDDMGLRLSAIEVRVSSAREAREKWFEELSRLMDDVLRNRSVIRELQDAAKK